MAVSVVFMGLVLRRAVPFQLGFKVFFYTYGLTILTKGYGYSLSHSL